MLTNLQEVLCLNGPCQLVTYVLDVDQPTFDVIWFHSKVTYKLQPPNAQMGWTAVVEGW